MRFQYIILTNSNEFWLYFSFSLNAQPKNQILNGLYYLIYYGYPLLPFRYQLKKTKSSLLCYFLHTILLPPYFSHAESIGIKWHLVSFCNNVFPESRSKNREMTHISGLKRHLKHSNCPKYRAKILVYNET